MHGVVRMVPHGAGVVLAIGRVSSGGNVHGDDNVTGA